MATSDVKISEPAIVQPLRPPPLVPFKDAVAQPAWEESSICKMSLDLYPTLLQINQAYNDARCETAEVADDAAGNLVLSEGDRIGRRYRIVNFIGEGSFGRVYRCTDPGPLADQPSREGPLTPDIGAAPSAPATAPGHVAVKVIKRARPFRRQGAAEVAALADLGARDSGAAGYPIVRLLDAFWDRGHICIVMECFSSSLYDLLNGTQFRGLSLGLVKKLAVHILKGICFMQWVGYIHGDLKPENVLLAHPRRSAARIIDLGSAAPVTDPRTSSLFYAQSRFYRAPEVILQLGMGPPCDVWSAGCLLAELHLGLPLFPGMEEIDQLRKQMEVLGPPPPHMVLASPRREALIRAAPGAGFPPVRRSRPDQQEPAPCTLMRAPPRLNEQNRAVPASRSETPPTEHFPHPARVLTRLLQQKRESRLAAALDAASVARIDSNEQYGLFQALLERMLAWDPDERITAAEALESPFFAEHMASIHADFQQMPDFYDYWRHETGE